MSLSIPLLDPDTDTLTAALAYARCGWYVLPVERGSKHAGSVLGKAWETRTSRDPEVITAWFAGTDHGLALHCGRSGAVVFDVDRPDAVPEVLTAAITAEAPPHQSTRDNHPGRGHYVFAVPEGRDIGCPTKGWFGGACGEVRGRNGIIVVAPSEHEKSAEGGRYEWLQTGDVPMLPDCVAKLLPDAGEKVDAATDERVRAFLDAHTTGDRLGLLTHVCDRFTAETANGASRHVTAVDLACYAMKEARAGFYPATVAAERLGTLFRESLSGEPGRFPADEWRGILAFAVGAALDDDPEARRAKLEARNGTRFTPVDMAPEPVTLEQAHAVFRRWLGADYDLGVLDVVLCCAAVERLSGDPVWLLVISGSGAAKTETVVPLAGAGALVTSTVSSEGALLSGTSKRERSKNATGGLLRKLGEHGLLVIKDVTSILSMNRDARGAVLAAMREVYDGLWSRNLGSDGGQTLEWSGRIVVIGAVTTAWDRAHEVVASMGDRFVLVRLDSTAGRVRSGRQAIANTGDEDTMRAELSAAVGGVLAGVDTDADLALSEAEADHLLELADIVTLARTGVEHDYRGDVVDAHAPEMPTRFARQLTQVVRGGLALGIHRCHALALAARCACDSMPPLRLAALLDVLANPDSTTHAVRKRMGKPRATVDRTLQALHMLGLVVVDEDDSGSRTVWRYTIADGVDTETLAAMGSARNGERYTHPSDPLFSVHKCPCGDNSGTTSGRVA